MLVPDCNTGLSQEKVKGMVVSSGFRMVRDTQECAPKCCSHDLIGMLS